MYNCPTGTYSLEGASKCSPCPTGAYSIKGSSKCSLCQRGTYSLEGASKCSPCQRGTYSKKEGSSLVINVLLVLAHILGEMNAINVLKRHIHHLWALSV